MTELHISQQRSQRPSAALRQRIRRHRQAFLSYDRLVPLGDPLDHRYSPDAAAELDRWQSLEARRRRDLLALPVRSLSDMLMKAGYLLSYPGSDFLLSEAEDIAVFLNSMKLRYEDNTVAGIERRRMRGSRRYF